MSNLCAAVIRFTITESDTESQARNIPVHCEDRVAIRVRNVEGHKRYFTSTSGVREPIPWL